MTTDRDTGDGLNALVRRLTDWTAQGTLQFADFGRPTWCANVDMPGGHTLERHVLYCAGCRARMPELLAARDAREKHTEELRAAYEERRHDALKGRVDSV